MYNNSPSEKDFQFNEDSLKNSQMFESFKIDAQIPLHPEIGYQNQFQEQISNFLASNSEPFFLQTPLFNQAEASIFFDEFPKPKRKMKPRLTSEIKRRTDKPLNQSLLKVRPIKFWTIHEDEQLKKSYIKNKGKWKEIVKDLPDRNISQCKLRHRRLGEQKVRENSAWTAEEDQKLSQLVQTFGQKWKAIEKLMCKTAKKLRERYINHLDPDLRREQWKEEEDKQILSLVKEKGKKWAEISKFLIGRSVN